MNNPFLAPHEPWIRSLNLAYLVDLPGISLPENLKGKRGDKLLSLKTLVRNICSEVPGYADIDDKSEVLRKVQNILEGGDKEPREKVTRVISEYAFRLAVFLLMLKRGDKVNREARASEIFWSDRHWDFWHNVSRLIIGGGLASGPLGESIAFYTQDCLTRNGCPDLHVELSQYNPFYLCLIGAARLSHERNGHALMIDVGKTVVKRGIARFVDEELVELELLSNFPSIRNTAEKCFYKDPEKGFYPEDILNIVMESYEASVLKTGTLSTVVHVCLSCYLVDGHPTVRFSKPYKNVRKNTKNFSLWLSTQISERVGHWVYVRLIHDGDAAAYALAGTGAQAIITLGTAIGVGFPPACDDGLRAVSDNFKIN